MRLNGTDIYKQVSLESNPETWQVRDISPQKTQIIW